MGDSALATVTQIGFTVGGYYLAGPFGGMVGSILGAYVAQELFGPSGSDIETSRGRIADLKVATSEYGFPIKHVWGCARCGGIAHWNSDLIEKVHVEESEAEGGKGGGAGTTATSKTYYYSIDIGYKFAISLEHFPVVAMPMGWFNGKLVWDFGNTNGPIFDAKYIGDTGGPFNQGTIRIRLGEEDQGPDPTYEIYGGVGTTPTDRGYATIACEDFPLEDFGNSPPQANALVCTAANPLYPYETMDDWTVNTVSARFAPDGRTLYEREVTNPTTSPALVDSDTREYIVKGGTSLTLQPLVGTGNSNGNAPAGIYDIDIFGRILSADPDLSSVLIPFLHDTRDYSVIARAEKDASNIVSSGASGMFYGPRDERFIFTGNSGNSYAVFATNWFIQQESGVNGATFTGPLLPLVTRGGWSTHSLPGSPELAIDEQTGELWTAHNSGSDTILVHWSLDFVQIDQFTVVGENHDRMGYDPATHSFIFTESTPSDHLWRWDIALEDIHPVQVSVGYNDESSSLASIHDGYIYMEGGNTISKVNLIDMVVEDTYDIDAAPTWNLPAIGGAVYDPYLHAIVISNEALNTPVYWIFIDRLGAGSVTLEDILMDSVFLSGYTGGSSDADASDHSTTDVLGWAEGNQTQIVDATTSMADLYKFGHVESDHKIKFPARGQPVTFALTDDDLGYAPFGTDDHNKLMIERIDQSELPLKSEIRFMDPDMDYQEGFQTYSFVPDTVPGTDKTESRTFRVTMLNLEARQRAFLHLVEKHADQQRYTFRLSVAWMMLDPGDTGTITCNGKIHVVMIEQTSLGANYVYECTGVGFTVPSLAEATDLLNNLHNINATGFAPALNAPGAEGFIPQEITGLNITDFIMFDTVFLDDSVDQGNDVLVTQMTAARRNKGLSWDGALFQRAAPSGGDFLEWHLYLPAYEGLIGRTMADALEKQRYWYEFDDDSSVNVLFPGDTVLSSVSDAELMQGRNAFLIGDELIQAGTITDNGNGTFTLTHLLRGRRGTEWAMGWQRFEFLLPGHSGWERVAFLGDQADLNGAMAHGGSFDDLNVEFAYRASALGSSAGHGLDELFTNTGNSARPLAPIPFSATKSGANWSFQVCRRSRVGGELKDLADIPLTDPEVYEIDIYEDPSFGDTLLRTITSTATAAGSVINADGTGTYAEADMKTDFGEDPLASSIPLYRLRAVAYQVNADTVGRGFAGASIIEDFPDPLPADSDYSNVSLLLHFNSVTPPDRSPNAFSLVYGSALSLVEGDWVDEVSQYGIASVDFSNTAESYIRLPQASFGSQFDFGTDDFTVECWTSLKSEGPNGIISCYEDTAPNRQGWRLFVTSAGAYGEVNFEYVYGTDSLEGIAADLLDGDFDAIKHIAVTRESDLFSIYVDGVRLTSSTRTSRDFVAVTTMDLYVGRNADADTGHYTGWLDSLRVTKGVARYSGATYARPATAFPNY